MLIVFATHKGGSGKSTLLCNLLPVFIREGKKVAILDFDIRVRTSFKWGLYRSEDVSLPKVDYSLDGDLEAALSENDHVFVDTPGVLSEDNIMLMSQADLIVIPLKVSQADLETLPDLVSLVERLQVINPRIRMRFVLNECPTNTNEEKDEIVGHLVKIGIEPIPTAVHSRKAYRKSLYVGKSVYEMNDAKAADEIASVYKDIFCSTPVQQTTTYIEQEATHANA